MDYVALMKRGDLKGAAIKSFDCVMCGLCASRCPAQISQFTAAMFVRRLYGKYVVPKADHLETRAEEVKSGKYEKMHKALAIDEARRGKRALREKRTRAGYERAGQMDARR